VVQVEPKVANKLRRGNGNVIEEDRRAGLFSLNLFEYIPSSAITKIHFA
jgi:hypothetical protein